MTNEERQTVIQALEAISDDDVICYASHHTKKERHGAFEPCPVAVRFKDALAIMRREQEQAKSDADSYADSYAEWLAIAERNRAVVGLVQDDHLRKS